MNEGSNWQRFLLIVSLFSVSATLFLYLYGLISTIDIFIVIAITSVLVLTSSYIDESDDNDSDAT